jgi:hypothetical protein
MKIIPMRPVAVESEVPVENVTLVGLGEALDQAVRTTRREESGVRRLPAQVITMRPLVRDGGMRL